jgi:hypothetical protein
VKVRVVISYLITGDGQSYDRLLVDEFDEVPVIAKACIG